MFRVTICHSWYMCHALIPRTYYNAKFQDPTLSGPSITSILEDGVVSMLVLLMVGNTAQSV